MIRKILISIGLYLVDYLNALASLPLYFIKEMKSVKVVVMLFLCYLMFKGIDSIALQIAIPIVFGFLFHLRNQEKTKGILLTGDKNG